MNQHFVPDIWWRVEDEANSAVYYVVAQVKSCTAVLALEGNSERLLLDSMAEHVTDANEIPGEMIEREQATIVPPVVAEFLLNALLSRSRADAATGDLNQRFTRECEQLGRRRATLLYWARTFESLWPLLRRAIGKVLKWGVVIDAVRRHF